jgi:DNA-binding NarL/FixJ family response regulator
VYLGRAYAAGAAGVVLETATAAELLQIVRHVARGERVFSRTQLQWIDAWLVDVEARLEQLTVAEREVLRLLAARRRNAEIACQLFVSLKTVETHVNHIFGKLGVDSRRELWEWLGWTHALDME